MRDCKFIVADKNMEFAIKGFFGRGDFHRKLACRDFAFDPQEDLYSARGKNDPGLYANGDPIFRVCQDTHRHAVVIVDADWEGSPGAAKIQSRLERHLESVGWNPANCSAIVIDPELENWIWIPHDNVGRVLGWGAIAPLQQFLRGRGHWEEGASKPTPPKEALEASLKYVNQPRSSKLYEKILNSVPGVNHCEDAAFMRLRATLQGWFPPEAP